MRHDGAANKCEENGRKADVYPRLRPATVQRDDGKGHRLAAGVLSFSHEAL
jgi:hypothetical protein